MRVEDAAEVAAVGYAVSDSTMSPYAAISNGRVHYSATSALPPTLLSSRRPRDVGAYTPDALPAFYDRRDLLPASYDRRSVAPTAADDDDDDYTAPVELQPSRLQFVHTLGRGLFGDVSILKVI